LASAWTLEPGAVMTLCAAGLFGLSFLAGTHGGLLQTLARRPHLASRPSA
jgi:hypothetical protein